MEKRDPADIADAYQLEEQLEDAYNDLVVTYLSVECPLTAPNPVSVTCSTKLSWLPRHTCGH
ncbi:MAG: hypothetical protein M3014_11585 [Chloroflexota bacterium]|nr:hypothetical protein [Chloroflexota bacterium]